MAIDRMRESREGKDGKYQVRGHGAYVGDRGVPHGRFRGKVTLMIPMIRRVLPLMLLVLLTSLPAGAAGQIPSPGGKDKCPVCGMFVAKYPDWTAAVRFRDATVLYFDGCKDLFTCYLNAGKYIPAKSRDAISEIQVKDYYGLKQIDGRKAFYVIGSNVYGPMGKELVPFEKASDADGFMHDHKGKRVLRFNQITPDVLKTLE